MPRSPEPYPAPATAACVARLGLSARLAASGVSAAPRHAAPAWRPAWRLCAGRARRSGGVALVAVQDSLHIPGELGIGSDELLTASSPSAASRRLLWFAAIGLVLTRPLPRSGALRSSSPWPCCCGVVPLLGPSFLSTDLYRYVWDGRVQNAGHQPLPLHPRRPASWPRCATPAIYPHINRADYAPTIYPPAAQAVFAAVAAVAPTRAR